ncbi:MAG: GNAT family N-acetyltransferase [Pseudomonas sp.]|uniref:GNAT family N-acetyltransferase n=1 Tax=Pseudomonas sp. TaxID=306 RepID=UPI00339078FE
MSHLQRTQGTESPIVQRIDAEHFAHYRPGLIDLLLDAVGQGASVGFLANLERSEAYAYFDEVLSALEKQRALLWVAVEAGQVVGSVQLALCQKANGLNRAEVQKLLVLHQARRRGLGQRLMQALEQAAGQYRRGLLYLDTEAGSAAELFYQRLDYQRAGELPNYACDPSGQYKPTALYYKTLGLPA